MDKSLFGEVVDEFHHSPKQQGDGAHAQDSAEGEPEFKEGRNFEFGAEFKTFHVR